MRSMFLCVAALALSASSATAADKVEATIKLFQFQPGTITVKAGTTVEWVNGDDIDHSVTSGEPGKPDKNFDSGFFKKDGHWAFTFAKPGTYHYFCKRHPSMKAEVVVTE